MELNVDSSGNAELNVEIHPVFRDYLKDISDVLSEDTDQQGLFDIKKIRETAAAREGVTLDSVSVTGDNILNLKLSFKNVEVMANNAEMEDVVRFSTKAGVHTLDFHLTAANFRSLFAIAGMQDSPLIDTFGPSDIAPWTQDEYLENVSYALEENATAPEIRKMFLDASIRVTVNVKGQIVSQTGGTLNGNSVVFLIPLLRVLTLETPLDLQVQYR